MTSTISSHPALSRTMQGGDMLQADEVVAMRRLHEDASVKSNAQTKCPRFLPV